MAAAKKIVRPPAGMYDPALDAQLGQVTRGYADAFADYIRDFGQDGRGGRAFNDYQLGVEDITRQVAEGRQDIGRARTRGTEDFGQQEQDLTRRYDRSQTDLLTGRTRGQEDFATAIANIGRQFRQLGTVQAQQASAAGLGGGGALRQALRARRENQALEEQPVRTSFDRFMSDSQLAESRLGEDRTRDFDVLGRERGRYFDDLRTQEERAFGLDPSKIGGAAGRELAGLSLGYGRQVEDAGTALARTGREATQFGVDTQAQRLFQATQLGYEPPAVPKPKLPAAQTPLGPIPYQSPGSGFKIAYARQMVPQPKGSKKQPTTTRRP